MTGNVGISKTYAQIEAVLSSTFEKIKNEHGYNLSFKRGSYDASGNIYFKIDAVKDGAESRDTQIYENKRIRFGLPPLETELNYFGKRYWVVGANQTTSKLKVRNEAGKIQLMPVETAKLLWKNGK